MFGKSYRGNAGVRVVRTTQTGSGMQSVNGAPATPVAGGTLNGRKAVITRTINGKGGNLRGADPTTSRKTSRTAA